MKSLTHVLRIRRAIDPLETSDRPDAAFDAAWRPALKRRVVVVLALAGCWMTIIGARLVQLQVFQHAHFVQLATRQHLSEDRPVAKRGDIVDRHGRVLAYSVDADAIVAYPAEVEDRTRTAEAVCAAVGDCSAKERAHFETQLSSQSDFRYLRRSRLVSPDQARRIAELDLPGVKLFSETRRYYPKKELAAHVLGFVGVDNIGLGGIESSYDSVIRGREGRVFFQRDARNRRLQTRVEQAPTAGAALELTIDLYLQHIVERELRAGVDEHRARGGTAIVMDPQTGEILALASYPTFNPNAFNSYPQDSHRNRAVQDLYEPGSTFKIVTASAALEESVWKPNDLIDCSPGSIRIGSRIIREAAGHNYGVISFEDVIVKSSNVGAIKAGLRIGAERLGRYVRRFGFGETLAPDFRGESKGLVSRPADLDDSGLASVSMGYQIGVTPIQMAAAMSAIANGGMLYEPHVVRAVIKDDVRQPVEPKALRRAIAPETSATLTAIMEGVVERGTAKAAALDRYQVAGKTGTAKKVIDGQYSDTDYNASFIGFVPSRRPAFTILVVIDTPRSGRHYGGSVAAPIFKRIAEAALQQTGVPPSINPVPPIVITTDAATPVPQPARATAILPTLTRLGGRTLMPDVRGLSAREAVRILHHLDLSVRVSGTGFVATQAPQPGEPIEPGGWGVLRLQRRPIELGPPGGHR